MEPFKEPEPEEQRDSDPDEPEVEASEETDEIDKSDAEDAIKTSSAGEHIEAGESDPCEDDETSGDHDSLGDDQVSGQAAASTLPEQDRLCDEADDAEDSSQLKPLESAQDASEDRAAESKLRFRWWRRQQPHKIVSKQEEPDNALVAASDQRAPESVDVQRWAVVDREGEVVEEDDGSALTTRSVEVKIEKLLTWMLAPAVHGIPKLGVPGAVDRANEILACVPGREVEAAVKEVVAGSEMTVSTIVANFCLERIPFVGCPTVLLKNTWCNLRSVLIIAGLYGHDLEKPRVQQEALLCLVPPGLDSVPRQRRAPGFATSSITSIKAGLDDACSPVVTETAQKVAKCLMKGALRHATGLQAAVDCFELVSHIYNNCISETVDEDGFVCVIATPASAARDFFRRKSLASYAMLWCSLPLLLLGMAAPGIFSIMQLAPKASTCIQEIARLPRWIPASLLAMPGILFAMHTLATAGGPRFRRLSPMRMWLRIVRGREATWLQEVWPQIVTVSVFMLHAVLPAISASVSLSLVLDSATMALGEESVPSWNRLHGIAYMTLGLYSFCTCVVQYVDSEKQEELAGTTPSRMMRWTHRFFSASWVISRACWILASWMYALLGVDLLATRAERWMAFTYSAGQEGSTLGVVGPAAWLLNAPSDENPLWSEKAIGFCLRTISFLCQQRLIHLLARREVLLRLIGAERITAQTVCLLLKGVAVACAQSTSANPVEEFFASVTPPAWCCVLVVALRTQAVVLGSTMALAPAIATSGVLQSSGSFAAGMIGGAYIARAILHVWYENQADLDMPALRLALIVPGSVSSKAKDLLSGAITGARNRAVQMMAMGFIQRLVRWFFKPKAALTM